MPFCIIGEQGAELRARAWVGGVFGIMVIGPGMNRGERGGARRENSGGGVGGPQVGSAFWAVIPFVMR